MFALKLSNRLFYITHVLLKFSLHTVHRGLTVEIWSRGILYIAPSTVVKTASALILSSGIHGNETGPIEMLNDALASYFEGTKYACVYLF